MNMANSEQSAIRLSFVGDICLSMGVEEVIAEHDIAYPFQYLQELMDGSDLRVGNFECSLSSDHQLKQNKTLMLVSPEKAQGIGQHSGFNVFGLANNHIMDAGIAGLEATRDLLQRENILSFGAGACSDDAEKPVIYQVKGRKVAFLGACDVSALDATKDKAGVASWNEKRLKKQIEALSTTVDLIIVNLHGDLEFTEYPQPARVSLSRRLADYGAHLIIQHHPHVVQGIEYHNGSLIAYSLGNCIFQVENNHYQQQWPGTNTGMVLEVNVGFDNGAPQLDYLAKPFNIGNEHRPKSMGVTETQRWLKNFKQISQALSDHQKISMVWKERCKREAKRRFGDLYWSLRRYNFKTVATEIKHMLFSREQRRWIYGLFVMFFK